MACPSSLTAFSFSSEKPRPYLFRCKNYLYQSHLLQGHAMSLSINNKGKNSYFNNFIFDVHPLLQLWVDIKLSDRFNITFLPFFYHGSIKDFCKERHFPHGGKRKIVVTGKLCGGRNRRIGGRRNGKTKRKDKMYVYKEQEFHAQNGVVRTLAISNKV